jgi:hypothetical protein
MSYNPPEFGEDAYLEYLGGIGPWPNVNVYEALAVAETTLNRLDTAASLIANADETAGGEAGRQQALSRMGDVRSRLTKVWIPALEQRIANLGGSENCASLTTPGSGLFTWLIQKIPGSVTGQPYLMEGDAASYGLTQKEITTRFTPEFASPDYFVQTYLVGENRDEVQGIIDAVFMTNPNLFAYECVDPKEPVKTFTVDLSRLGKPEPEPEPEPEPDPKPDPKPKSGFPWLLLLVAVGVAASRNKKR